MLGVCPDTYRLLMAAPTSPWRLIRDEPIGVVQRKPRTNMTDRRPPDEEDDDPIAAVSDFMDDLIEVDGDDLESIEDVPVE